MRSLHKGAVSLSRPSRSLPRPFTFSLSLVLSLDLDFYNISLHCLAALISHFCTPHCLPSFLPSCLSKPSYLHHSHPSHHSHRSNHSHHSHHTRLSSLSKPLTVLFLTSRFYHISSHFTALLNFISTHFTVFLPFCSLALHSPLTPISLITQSTPISLSRSPSHSKLLTSLSAHLRATSLRILSSTFYRHISAHLTILRACIISFL